MAAGFFTADEGLDADAVKRRRKIAESLAAMARTEARTTAGGLGRLGLGIVSALMGRSADGAERKNKAEASESFSRVLASMLGDTPASRETASSGSAVQKALLDTIAGPESGGKYNVIYGGGLTDNLSDHPRQNIPIKSGPNTGKTSSAAGRYQFLGSTWDAQRDKLGLKDFGPQSQDAAAWDLAATTFKQKTGQDLQEILASGDPQAISAAGNVLSSIWTSLPGGIEQGIGGNQFARKFQENMQGSQAGPQIAPQPGPTVPLPPQPQAATAGAKINPASALPQQQAAPQPPQGQQTAFQKAQRSAAIEHGGMTPSAQKEIVRAAQQAGMPPEQLVQGAAQQVGGMPMAQLLELASNPNLTEMQTSIVDMVLKQKLDTGEWKELNDGTIFNAKTGERQSAPVPRAPINMTPGNTIFDPNTQQPVFTAPPEAAKPVDPSDQRLKDAQIRKTEAEISKLSSPAQPDFKDVTSLRKEFGDLPAYKKYANSIPIYQSMVETAPRDSKASDANLTYGLAKIFDPESVVREGELVIVRDTGSLPDWLVGQINGLNGGARLQPETRAAIMKEAESRMLAYREGIDIDIKNYEGIASRYGFRRDDVIPQLQKVPAAYNPAAKKSGNPASSPGAQDNEGWTALPNGVRIREKR